MTREGFVGGLTGVSLFQEGCHPKGSRHKRGLSHREETGELGVWPIGIKGFKASEGSRGVRSEEVCTRAGGVRGFCMHVRFCLKERAQLLKGSERSNGFMQHNWLKGSPLACTPEGSKGLKGSGLVLIKKGRVVQRG